MPKEALLSPWRLFSGANFPCVSGGPNSKSLHAALFPQLCCPAEFPEISWLCASEWPALPHSFCLSLPGYTASLLARHRMASHLPRTLICCLSFLVPRTEFLSLGSSSLGKEKEIIFIKKVLHEEHRPWHQKDLGKNPDLARYLSSDSVSSSVI